ncbi:DELETION OF SUV3 SUPPRESSOR 1(I)-like [Olea europaea subsp. europaea]|nr:DELETION OF SUV3 SUPPRESSOR 1(I)-like [Olea europaea subsp. europaea]
MATEQPKPATEDPKIDLFEDDDEFEEFEIGQEWDDKEEGKEVTQQWEDDWDDDDVNDDFSLQLRRELESNTEKIEAKST